MSRERQVNTFFVLDGAVLSGLSPELVLKLNWSFSRCSLYLQIQHTGIPACNHAFCHMLCFNPTQALSTTLPRLLPLLLHCPIIPLLPALLDALYILILALKPSSLILTSKHFLHKSLLPRLVLNPRTVELCRSLDHNTDLRVLRHLEFALLTIHAFGVEDGTHVEELKVALQSRREIGAWKVVPAGKSRFRCTRDVSCRT
jgi:hypothetical protein